MNINKYDTMDRVYDKLPDNASGEVVKTQYLCGFEPLNSLLTATLTATNLRF